METLEEDGEGNRGYISSFIAKDPLSPLGLVNVFNEEGRFVRG